MCRTTREARQETVDDGTHARTAGGFLVCDKIMETIPEDSARWLIWGEVIRAQVENDIPRAFLTTDLEAAANPQGVGVFVFYRKLNGTSWIVIDDIGYPLTDQAKGFTPHLSWPRDDPNLEWSRTELPWGGVGTDKVLEIIGERQERP